MSVIPMEIRRSAAAPIERDPAVVVDGITKTYRVLHNRTATLKSRVLSTLLPRYRERVEDFKVLDDVSFSVARHEAIALMGPNGSGKSTLLQLIAGILRPDRGRIQVHGRIAPLIELGAGFHPELTGLENIFLNASLYGFRNAEIQRRVDQIIDFSGLARFVDSPVKNYSTGMYMRLGFSIAVHLDPDILLADEILAVGDAEFQTQCYDRIEELRKAGTTLILVTHDENQARRYCTRFLRLEAGKLVSVEELDE